MEKAKLKESRVVKILSQVLLWETGTEVLGLKKKTKQKTSPKDMFIDFMGKGGCARERNIDVKEKH